MDEQVGSRTAMAAALARSLHSMHDPLPLIDDRWGHRFVPDAVLEGLVAAFTSGSGGEPQDQDAPRAPLEVLHAALGAMPAYANVVVRTRFTEDLLARSIDRGVRQYVLVGAGLDSFALRRPDPTDVDVFEVDHPATQGFKRQRFAALGIEPPASLVLLPADLSEERLTSVLGRSPFDSGSPAFFSWLGVTMYLTREANVAALRAIAECAASGSELVLSYIDQAVFGGATAEGFEDGQRAVTSLGEPWLSGFDPSAIGDDLDALGFDLIEDVSDAELAARYDPDDRNGLAASAVSRVCHVRIR